MKIEPLIYQQNPQWLSTFYSKPEKDWFTRPEFFRILSFLNKRVAIAVTGLRRVGKSTLLYQIKYHLEEKINPKNIFFFSFEKSQVKYETEILRTILNWYFETFLRSPPKFLKEKVYIFLDEIQYIPNWQEVVKTFYDLTPQIKFFLSGSTSLFIKKTAVESLAGRMIEMTLPPLRFSEFFTLKKNLINKNPKKLYQEHPQLLISLFEEYLSIGQFPELIGEKYSQNQAKLYLSSIEEKIIEQDIPKTFPVKRVDILRLIFDFLKKQHSEIFEFSYISNDLGIDLKTTIKYFDFFKKSFLIDFCLNRTKKLLKSGRVAKKIYLTSTNFSLNTVSKKVENYVFNFFSSSYSTQFFRKKNLEIDFIIKTEINDTLIEVKYKEELKSDDYKNIIKLAKAFKVKTVYIISKNYLGTIKQDNLTLKIIPVCLLELTSLSSPQISLTDRILF